MDSIYFVLSNIFIHFMYSVAFMQYENFSKRIGSYSDNTNF